MTAALWTALWALIAFQLKHFACDFVFQTRRQVATKGFYGHLGGIEHAGLHAITSLPALLVLTRSPIAIGATVVLEFVVHYHVDWTKARVDRTQSLTTADRTYWILFGLDQLIHQMTYIVIVFAILRFA